MVKNLIYTGVFIKEEYIELLYLWMKSLCLYGNLDRNTTEVLIYTSEKFVLPICDRLKDLEHYQIPILFHTFGEGHMTCIMQACSCRFQIFNNGFIQNYEKLLYLDTDILFNGDVNRLFNIPLDDNKIYATKSGYIGHIYWGANHIDFEKFDKTTPGFCSGAMLFKNSWQMRKLFDDTNDLIWYTLNTNQHIITNCYDQPFINTVAITQNKYDNEVLNDYIINNPGTTFDNSIVVYHLLGGLGDGITKLEKMNEYMEIMSENKARIAGEN
jgi:lipopolysaccharide biosynthesis glycosyltransferase